MEHMVWKMWEIILKIKGEAGKEKAEDRDRDLVVLSEGDGEVSREQVGDVRE